MFNFYFVAAKQITTWYYSHLVSEFFKLHHRDNKPEKYDDSINYSLFGWW